MARRRGTTASAAWASRATDFRVDEYFEELQAMARVCELCGRSQSTGYQYARRGLAKAKGGVGKKVTGRTKRRFKPNIQSVRVVEKGRHMRRRVCTRCIKSGRIRKSA